MNIILCMLCALVTQVYATLRSFVDDCYCMFLVCLYSSQMLCLKCESRILEWLWGSWASGDSKSWYVGHCPSSPIGFTDCFGLCDCTGQGTETCLWLEQNFPYTMVWEAVSLNFWFFSVVVMSCSFLRNYFLEYGFYFLWLSVSLLDRVDVSVLPLAFQKNEEKRAQAFCVIM